MSCFCNDIGESCDECDPGGHKQYAADLQTFHELTWVDKPPVGEPAEVCDYCHMPVGVVGIDNNYVHYFKPYEWYLTIHPRPYEGREFVAVNGKRVKK